MSEREKRLGLSGRPEERLDLVFDAVEAGLSFLELEALRIPQDGKGGETRGRAAEKRVEAILQGMVEEGKLFSFRRARREENQQGADFFFVKRVKRKKEIPLQVKTNVAGATIFRKEEERRGGRNGEFPEIEVIVAGSQRSNLNIRRQVEDVVNRRKGKRP